MSASHHRDESHKRDKSFFLIFSDRHKTTNVTADFDTTCKVFLHEPSVLAQKSEKKPFGQLRKGSLSTLVIKNPKLNKRTVTAKITDLH